MNDLPEVIDRLAKRIEALERSVDALGQRIAVLEHPLAARWPHASTAVNESPEQDAEGATAAQAGNIFALLGRALLGIAGAYLLRAVVETSALPKLAVALAGIAYAFLWLVWAARVRGGQRLASSVYAATSALILAPMLWELTLRFKLLPATMSAAVVCCFALAAIGLAWKHEPATVLRVAIIASAALALALAIASHAMLPYIAALLVLAACSEAVPALDTLPEVRALAALAADTAIWILIYRYFPLESAHADYPQLGKAELLAPGTALFLLFAGSVCAKTVWSGRKITAFEAVQLTIAFLLAAVSIADFGPAGSVTILGVACLALSATCYAAVFTLFKRAPERRNAAVFAAWGAALLLAGSFLCLPASVTIIVLGGAAIAATLVGSRRRWLAAEFYGMVFLLAAAATSGLLSFIASALVATPPGTLALGVWLAALSAVACYAFAKPCDNEARMAQVLHLAAAALATGAATALLVTGLTALAAIFVQPGAHHLAFIRTLALCTVALALAFSGARWRRAELTRLCYAVLGLVAMKLLFEDMRHGRFAYIAASISLVALTLIAAPRAARLKQKA